MPIQPLVPGLGQFPAVISFSYMSPSPFSGANGFELDGVSASDSSGCSVSTAGDVNHDGIADIIIGASNANSAAGKAYVVFGKASDWNSSISLSTLNGTNGFELDGVSANDASGWLVSTAGDVNQDGIADIIIEAPNANGYAGKTYVVFGKANGWTSPISLSVLNGTNGFAVDGVPGEFSGSSVRTAGDVNHDGIADIIIGASNANSAAGKAYVVFGKASGWTSSISLSTLNGTNGFELDGVSANDQSGWSVSTAGDVNHDGIDDIVIGAPNNNGGFNPNCGAGKTFVVFGKAGAWTSPISLSTLNGANGFELDGVSAYDQSGYSVSTAGDVNHDGIDDIVIGAPSPNADVSKTYVVFGKASGWTSPISLSTLNGTNGFEVADISRGSSGRSVSTAGDVNNDGIADIIIGAGTTNPLGKAYVVFGKASGWTSSISLSMLNGTDGFELDPVGSSSSISFGYSVSTAGDVNNDGIADIIIGATGANGNAGTTYVVFGDSPPVLVNNSLTIGADCTVTLNSTYLAAYDLNHANSTLTFTASDVSNGYFQQNVLGVITPLTTPMFLQSDITAGYIQFVSNSSNASGYSMAVSSSGFAFVPATPAVVSFTASCTAAPTQAPSKSPTLASSFAPSTQIPSRVPSSPTTLMPSESPTLAPSFALSTQIPSRAPSSPTTLVPSKSPTLAPSFAPSSVAVSSAARTSPAWFLPVSQVASLLDSSIPAAYQSVSGYLSGLDASSQPATHNTPYASSSLETMGAQLMLGAVALKLAQKGINWAKSFWVSEPMLKPDAKPVLAEEEQSLQTPQDSEDMQHLTKRMGACKVSLGENSAQSAEVFYPDFQKPGINFTYGSDARKNTPSVTEQAAFTNSARLATRAR